MSNQTAHIWQGKHRGYAVGEHQYPGVTTILSATKPKSDKIGLEIWRQKVGFEEADRVSKNARERGKIIHSQIEQYFSPTAGSVVLDDSVSEYWDSVKQILPQISNPISTEMFVSHPYGFAGLVDIVAEFNNQLSVIDWKTSKSKKTKSRVRDYLLQVSAYTAAYNFMNQGTREPIKTASVIIAVRNSKPQVFTLNFSDLQDCWGMFKERLVQFYNVTGWSQNAI